MEKFRIDPATLPPAVRAAMPGHMASLATYAGTTMAFAAAIPGARFQLLTATGHLPQVETPEAVREAITSWTPASDARGEDTRERRPLRAHGPLRARGTGRQPRGPDHRHDRERGLRRGDRVSSIAETLELHGRPLLLNAGQAAQQAAVLPALASRPGIHGAIIVLPPEPSEQLVALRARGFPFVVVDPRAPLPRDIAAVSAAHFAGARNITRHLVGLGHRRVGVIAGPPNWLASDARLAGHTSPLADVGVLPDSELVRGGEPTAQFGYRSAGELLDLPQRPTALIGFNDKVAVGALAAAARRGLRVPGST